MKIQITARFTGLVLFEHEAENNTMKLTLEAAISARANLAGAYLACANLARANLARANLAGAYLAGAYLAGAYLAGANLAGANLACANLARANLAGANLDGANLAGANLADKSELQGDRPILQIGPIGSRCAYFVAYLTNNGLRLHAGCFFGTRDEFEKKLQDEHDNNDHAKEYRAALAMIDAHAEIWTPKLEEKEAA